MKRVWLAAALLLLVTLPFWIGNSFYVNVATQMLIYAVFALGLNVVVGYAGLVSLGHAALFGVAAYAGATLIVIGNLVTGQHSFNGDRVDLIEKDWFEQCKFVLEAMMELKEVLGIGDG